MIKLVKNELLKLGYFKFIVSCIIFIILSILICYVNRKDSLNEIYKCSYTLIPFIGVSISILFGGIMSNEYNDGTFKMYFSKPYSRYKILLSKLLVELLYVLLIIIVVNIIFMIYVKYFYTKLFIDFLIYSIPLLLISILNLFLSTLTKNSVLTSSICIVLLITSNLLVQMFLSLDINFIQYTFLPYLDNNIFVNKDYLLLNEFYNINLTLNKSIFINLIYSIMFYIFTNFILIKKDITS